MELSGLRALQIITTPLELSGLPLYPLRMAERMSGVRSDFLACRVADGSVRERAEAAGGTVYVAPSRMRHPFRYIRFVSRLIREQGYDIVHVHGNSCTMAVDLLAARLGGAKARVAHSHNSRCRYTAAHRLLRPLFNALYTHAMACGEEAGRWLFGEKPFEVARNAIDTKSFAYDEAARRELRAELGLGDATALGCVGGLTEVKNQAFLIGLMPRLENCRLVLVGDGPLREPLERQARELGVSDRVIFTGPRADVPRVLQAMDVMLLPSLFEGFPTVALEWQCAGLPVLMSRAVTRDCALVDSVTSLPTETEAWIRAIPGPADRAARSRDGIAAVAGAGYDLADAAGRLEAAYRRCLTKESLE